MIQIRPVSDLRNKFTDIEKCVQNGEPVYLTKNGYGTMVVLSIETYSRLIESEEHIMNVADALAEASKERLDHDEVFGKMRKKIKGKKE